MWARERGTRARKGSEERARTHTRERARASPPSTASIPCDGNTLANESTPTHATVVSTRPRQADRDPRPLIDRARPRRPDTATPRAKRNRAKDTRDTRASTQSRLDPRVTTMPKRCEWNDTVNDPSAGSPTETLLRLLLPLNDKVWTTSRGISFGEPTSLPQSKGLTGSFNR